MPKNFGTMCITEGLDEVGVTGHCYMKTFTFMDMEFQVVGLAPKSFPTNCVSVLHQGELYQFSPHFVGAAFAGNASKEQWENHVKTRMLHASCLTPCNALRHRTYGGSSAWADLLARFHTMGLYQSVTGDIFGKLVVLYGKPYTLIGAIHPSKRSGYRAMVKSMDGKLYQVPFAALEYALRHTPAI